MERDRRESMGEKQTESERKEAVSKYPRAGLYCMSLHNIYSPVKFS